MEKEKKKKKRSPKHSGWKPDSHGFGILSREELGERFEYILRQCGEELRSGSISCSKRKAEAFLVDVYSVERTRYFGLNACL